MQVHPENQQLELPQGIQSKLEDFRRRVWAVKLAEGVLAAVFGLVLSYLAVFVLDRFFDTPAWLRATILITGTVGLAVVLPYTWHRWVWRTRRLESVARVLRRRFHRLGDQLLGIVELVHTAPKHQQSEELCRAALKQVDEQTREVDFAGAVPNPRHRRWAWAAGIPLAIALAALVIIPAAGTNALARWLMPWRETERYTFAQLDELPDNLVVPFAEPFTVTAKLSPETAWSPGSGSAQYGGQPSVTSPQQEGGYKFDLPPQKESDKLAVAVGDARKSITVQPTTRPELTAMNARIKLPEYLQYSEDQVQDIRGGAISAVKGSEVTFTGTATRDLAGAEMDGSPQTTSGKSLVTYPVSIVDSSERSLVWRDNLGLSAKQPFVLSITAQEDGQPTLTCSELAREQVVLVSDVLSFKVLAEDDFGVKSIGLEWTGIEDPLRNPHPAHGEKIVSSGGPEKRIVDATATFSAEREGVPPQVLKVRLFAVDYLPDRERVYSPEYILYVLSPEEHAIWLTQRLRKWMRQAQGVYEREMQLHLTNQELRAMPADELDRPENRRRVETQAAAEQANARQLTAVAGEGEDLIKQAMRNDQFNVMTLEDWARMLQILDDIAQNRMPSVADLLKTAANAPSSGSSSKPGSPSPSQAPPTEQQKPQVGNNRDGKPGAGGEVEPGEPNKVPSIADVESSFNEANESQSTEPKKAKPGRLTLPVTTVQGGGAKQEPGEQQPSPAKEDVERAVEEQEDLLAEFAKVAEELQLILDNLEGSTFVKRLKAASRRQLEVASDLNNTLLTSFGLEQGNVDESTRMQLDKVSERETAESDNVYVIQDDMEAYFNRVHQAKFRTVLDEMRELEVATRLADLGQIAKSNMSGQSIAHAEYWADTLDRWAEQLVGPGCPGQGQCEGGGASLPPAVVLEVLKILEAEIDLREETRGVEQAREALELTAYTQKAEPLAETQGELAERVAEVIKTLLEIPDGDAKYPQELGLLSQVEGVMREAQDILAEPNTGAEAIAAETEAIELLLAAKRCNPNGGGGGGATPGGGGGGETDDSALALIGVGQELNANYQARNVGQATGTGGASLPAEFRAGLDAYFTALEESGQADAN